MRSTTFIAASLVCLLILLCGTASASGGWTWPVRGPVLTPYANAADPYAAGQHRGIDIGAPVGARVVAASGGTVTFAGVVGSSGLVVSERTADGQYDLSYLHLSAAAVHRGDAVAAGEAVGAVGVSGTRSTDAPHLHFGVREAGSRSAYRDPLDFLSPPPAGDAPRPVPVPLPVADPSPAAPIAVPAAGGRPATLPAPGVRRAPRVAAAAAAHPVVGLPALRALPKLGVAPRQRESAGGTQPRPVPDLGRGPLDSSRRDAVGAAANAPASHPRRRGIDVGWLAACLGLVLAATALGNPAATRRAAVRTRVALGALLRPTARGG
jgi:hypothetical protein